MALQTTRKPIEARQIEARSRARDLAVKVTVIEAGMAYSTRSQAHPGTVYTISRERHGWQCDPGYVYTGCCKHLAQVQRRSEREGWSFGVIARRPAA